MHDKTLNSIHFDIYNTVTRDPVEWTEDDYGKRRREKTKPAFAKTFRGANRTNDTKDAVHAAVRISGTSVPQRT
jgi:hypothetical protein